MSKLFLKIQEDKIIFLRKDDVPDVVDEARRIIFQKRMGFLLGTEHFAGRSTGGERREINDGYSPGTDRIGFLIEAMIDGSINYAANGGYTSHAGIQGADLWQWPISNPRLSFSAHEDILIEGLEKEIRNLYRLATEVENDDPVSFRDKLLVFFEVDNELPWYSFDDKKQIKQYLTQSNGDRIGYVACEMYISASAIDEFEKKKQHPDVGRWMSHLKDAIESKLRIELGRRGWASPALIVVNS